MKTALVTGATGGIGRALSKGLVEEGFLVIGLARNEKKLKKLAEELDNFDYLVADLSDIHNPRLIAEVLRERGVRRIDVLINNAGFAIRKPLLEHSPWEMEDIFNVNVLSPVLLTSELLPFLGEGSNVVFIISGVAFVNVPELPSYCATKGALHHLALNLERELRERGIGVLRVYPKQVKSEFWNGKVPKGSIEPEEVARATIRGLKKGKREVFVPGYLRLLKYLPNWPVLTYHLKY